MLIAPNTPPERARALAAASSGFCYLLARAGVTGAIAEAPQARGGAPDVADRVALLRSASSLPIACGFGISTPDQVAAVTAHADAAIVGSAIVAAMREADVAGQDPAAAAAQLTERLLAGTK